MSEHLYGILEHKKEVGKYLNKIITELVERAIVHGYSKFNKEEFDLFEKVTPILRKLTYGSDEYKSTLKEIKPAIEHHYKHNSHHPEYYENGVNDMNLLDVVEMLCDWMAAVKRHEDGDIYKSIEINKERFGLSDQLVQILKNTVEKLR